MDILFIWVTVGSPLYEWRLKCIRRAMAVYPHANFKVITTLKEFFGFKVIDAYEILENLKGFNIDINDPIWFSDYARYYWLSRVPNTLYIDTDTFCTAPIPLIKGIGHADYWAIWNGEDLRGIADVLSKHNDQRMLSHTPDLLAERGKNFSQYFEHKPEWRGFI